MSEPFIGEIKMVGFNYAPIGWAQCDGQLLPIAQHNALFALLGTQFGGDGRTTLGLPDLRGRFPMHYGSGIGLTSRNMGQKFGSETVILNQSQMPTHTHSGTVVSSTNEGDRNDPAGAYPARPEDPMQPYGGTTGGTMASDMVQIGNAGSGIPVDKMPPFQVVNFIIALTGLWPSRP